MTDRSSTAIPCSSPTIASFAFLTLAASLLPECSDKASHERSAYPIVAPPRDWRAHPAIVERAPAPVLYAMSDIHGGYDRMVKLLVAHHLLARPPAVPDGAEWSGGTSVLVVTGDVIDKGPSPLEAIDLLRAMEPQALAAGGQLIFTLGNHEAEFLYDPENDKANKEDGVNQEIRARASTPVSVADGSDPRGAWLRDRPFGARVGEWFFAHAGNTKGRSVQALEIAIRAGVQAHDYADLEAIGADSILEARGWYGSASETAPTYAKALGAQHIVFGHQPDALGPRGEIAVGFEGVLFRIDCGMSPNVDDSAGRMLRVHREGAAEVAESLDPEGTVREVWRSSTSK